MRKLLANIFLICFLAALPVTSWAAFSSLVSFGDSLSDNGINNIQPDYEGFDRFSNGWVWVDYLAVNLGVSHEGRAWGGATTGAEEYNLLWQVGEHYTPVGDISNTLFTIWAGGNDLRSITDPSSAGSVIGSALNNIGTAVSTLYGRGARKIMIPNLPDLGITPELNGEPLKSAAASQASQAFNANLNTLISTLSGSLLDLTIYELDVYSYVNDVILAGDFFANTTDQWLLEGGDASTFLFFDEIHPTTRAHQMLGDFAAATAVPVPSAVWMLGSGLLFTIGIRRKF